MFVTTATMKNGAAIFEPPPEVSDHFTEGKQVLIMSMEPDPPAELSPELEAELEASIAEMDAGLGIPADEFFADLRRRYG